MLSMQPITAEFRSGYEDGDGESSTHDFIVPKISSALIHKRFSRGSGLGGESGGEDPRDDGDEEEKSRKML